MTATSLIADAQQSTRRFEDLRLALTLTESQMARLEELAPAAAARARIPFQEAARLRYEVMDDAQRNKLAGIRTLVFNPGDVARLAARLGLVNLKDWERRFGGTYLFNSVRPYFEYTETTDVPLSRTQAERLEKLQQADPRTLLSRTVVMEILDSKQIARLAAFDEELQVASEAIELGLFAPAGEVLCH